MSEGKAQWQSRIVGYGEVAPDQINLHPLNMRAHPKQQQQALTELLGTVGFLQNVIVNKTTGYLLDGHARVELARAQGQLLVPVTYVELTAEEERAVLALYDQVGDLAELHEARARELLSQVEVSGETLQQVLFDVAAPLKSAGPTGADAPEKPAEGTVTNEDQVRMVQLFYNSAEYGEVMKQYLALREHGYGDNLSKVFQEVLQRAYQAHLQATPA